MTHRTRAVLSVAAALLALPLPALAAKKPYTAPAVQKYDDLEDLLLLDPIHEVDEAGWPVARAD